MGDESSVRSVARVLDLLELFSVEAPSRALRELVEGTGLPKTTVLRLVATLVARGVLAARADGSYVLGPEMLRWLRLAGATWTPSADVLAAMHSLTASTGETVNLYVRRDLWRVVVAQSEGTATVRSVVPVGVPLPLWAGAAGRVLLLDEPELVERVAALSPHGPGHAVVLRRAVEEGRARGFQVAHGEREVGSSALAFPVRGSRGRVVAALTLGGPTGRFTDDRLPTYTRLTAEAAEVVQAAGLAGLD